MLLAVVVLLGLGLLLWASRARELFCLSVRAGRVLVVRGRIPPAVLAAIRDVVAAPPAVEDATLRAVLEENGARLVVTGTIDEGRAQRLRNVFGIFPVAKLRAAPPTNDRTLGQFLGIAWLAWLLDRR